MRDTAAAAEQVRLDAIRRLAPIERLTLALELSESVRALGLARLRELHGDRPAPELMELLVGAPLIAPRPGDPTR